MSELIDGEQPVACSCRVHPLPPFHHQPCLIQTASRHRKSYWKSVFQVQEALGETAPLPPDGAPRRPSRRCGISGLSRLRIGLRLRRMGMKVGSCNSWVLVDGNLRTGMMLTGQRGGGSTSPTGAQGPSPRGSRRRGLYWTQSAFTLSLSQRSKSSCSVRLWSRRRKPRHDRPIH
jgi:hypothetical protein